MKGGNIPEHCKKIKKALIDKGMTQRQLALKVGMNENYLVAVLQGKKSGKKYLNEIFKILEIKQNEKAS